MATYSRREHTTRHVEYTVPSRGDGAAWVEVMKAIRESHQQLAAMGLIPDADRDAPDDMIRVTGDGEDVIVAISWNDHEVIVPPGGIQFRGYQTTAWALWTPRGELVGVYDHTSGSPDAVFDAIPGVIEMTGSTDRAHAEANGWYMEAVNAHEADFLRYLRRYSHGGDGFRVRTRDAWRMLVRNAATVANNPFGWALWNPEGRLRVVAAAGRNGATVDEGWETVGQYIGMGKPRHPTVQEMKDDAWLLDPLDERQYTILKFAVENIAVFDTAAGRDAWRRMERQDTA